MRKVKRQNRIKAYLNKKYDGLFPTRTEAKLIEVLGGTTVTIGRFRKFDRPMVLIVSRGRLLRSERFRRAALTADGSLANDVKWAIALQGPEYEHDVVSAYERDEALKAAGWQVGWFPARWLWTDPERFNRAVRKFLYS